MSSTSYLTPEARARVQIDLQLQACGWVVQSRSAVNVYAQQGVSVRKFIMAAGHGRVDYLLFIDGKAVGAIEAKPSGTPLAGGEPQSGKYSTGLPANLSAPCRPLPFLYESAGDETMFTDGFDPEARSRQVFTFHRPESLARWLASRRTTMPAGRFGPGCNSSALFRWMVCGGSRSMRLARSKCR